MKLNSVAAMIERAPQPGSESGAEHKEQEEDSQQRNERESKLEVATTMP